MGACHYGHRAGRNTASLSCFGFWPTLPTGQNRIRAGPGRQGPSAEPRTGNYCDAPGYRARIDRRAFITRSALGEFCLASAAFKNRVFQYTNGLNFTFDLVTRQAVARGRDHALLWLPPTSEFTINRPGGTSGRTRYDHHSRLKREIHREKINQFRASPNQASSYCSTGAILH